MYTHLKTPVSNVSQYQINFGNKMGRMVYFVAY